jgi:2-polyprenyl-6-hydroxyphenyl methylase / 3-demethylubiquinone-9 3-methyltransferase
MQQSPGSSVDPEEIARFSSLSEEFWDPRGKMRMLHRLNPVRLRFIRDAACRNFERDPRRLDCLSGLRILDIGCGGGLLSEPLARLGASVVGADASSPNIEVAKRHAEEAGIAVDYRATTAEALAEAGESFDLVLAMEVVEHVADLGLFVRCCAKMVKPDGLMLVATINRTLKSFALAIVGAEYVLGWLPRGTHRWDKLVTPNELEAALEHAGLRLADIRGVVYDLFADAWRLADDVDVNYMAVAARRA